MGKKRTGRAAGKSSLPILAVICALAVAAGFGAVYGILGGDGNDAPAPSGKSGKPAEKSAGELAAYSRGDMITFVARARPRVLPAVTFADGAGADRSLAEWRGKVVLLNLWATWCGPCREEMPTLDALKAELGGEGFDVVALSIDRTGLDKPRAFLEEIGVKSLELYNNASGKLAPSLKAFGLPTTLLIDREGREIGRLTGPAHWDSPDAKALIKAALGRES